MSRTTKQVWLDAGLQLLAEQGALALTIDRLTSQLGLTKGSFYHHFQGWPTYKHALLHYFETSALQQLTATRLSGQPPAVQIQQLFADTIDDMGKVATALRAWSAQDGEVRLVQERLDHQRVAHFQALCRQLLRDKTRAPLAGQVAYTLLVGSTQLQPPLSPAIRQQLLREFLRLYPVSGSHETGGYDPQ